MEFLSYEVLAQSFKLLPTKVKALLDFKKAQTLQVHYRSLVALNYRLSQIHNSQAPLYLILNDTKKYDK
jgi:hypothetical protein